MAVPLSTACSKGALAAQPAPYKTLITPRATPGRPQLILVGEPAPWYATAPTSALERRRELEDQRLRLLALGVGDHLPIELAQRARRPHRATRPHRMSTVALREPGHRGPVLVDAFDEQTLAIAGMAASPNTRRAYATKCQDPEA